MSSILVVFALWAMSVAGTLPAKSTVRLPVGPPDLSRLGMTPAAPATQAIAYWQDGHLRAEYPYFSARLHGRRLTKCLLGADHEAVMTMLGLSDSDPYDLEVQLERYEFDRDGQVRGPVWLKPMSKAAFDRYEARLVPVGVPPSLPRPLLYPPRTAAR
jgi:hypothetical protein